MSSLESHNPFHHRGVLHDPEQFIGRLDAFHFIFDQLLKEQCVSIVGKPLVGKSSLLQLLAQVNMQQRMGYDLRKFIFVVLDFADYTDYEKKSKENFFEDVCRQIMFSYRRETDGFTLTANDWRTNFKYLLQHLNGMGLRPVLLLDAFDKITQSQEFDFAFFSYLRNLAGRRLVHYVTASVNPLAKVCHPGIRSSAFFSLFIEYSLGPFTQEEAKQFIVSKMQDDRYRFEEDEVHWISEQAGGHPYLLEIACSCFFEEKFQCVGDLDLTEVQEQLYQKLSPTFTAIWSKLNEVLFDDQIQENISKEQSELLDEARRGSDPERQRNIPELSESRLFRNYIRERFHIETPDITFDDLNYVLRKLHNIELLSTCRLADTYYVKRRCDLARANGPVKKGKIVRELVEEAHARMKPDGVRNQSAPEWREYNILYLRYWKKFKAEVVFPSVGIWSKRDFFRKQKDAIETLLKRVCEIEEAMLKGE